MNHLYTDKTYLRVNKANPHIETKIIVSWYPETESIEGSFEYGSKERLILMVMKSNMRPMRSNKGVRK